MDHIKGVSAGGGLNLRPGFGLPACHRGDGLQERLELADTPSVQPCSTRTKSSSGRLLSPLVKKASVAALLYLMLFLTRTSWATSLTGQPRARWRTPSASGALAPRSILAQQAYLDGDHLDGAEVLVERRVRQRHVEGRHARRLPALEDDCLVDPHRCPGPGAQQAPAVFQRRGAVKPPSERGIRGFRTDGCGGVRSRISVRSA